MLVSHSAAFSPVKPAISKSNNTNPSSPNPQFKGWLGQGSEPLVIIQTTKGQRAVPASQLRRYNGGKNPFNNNNNESFWEKVKNWLSSLRQRK